MKEKQTHTQIHINQKNAEQNHEKTTFRKKPLKLERNIKCESKHDMRKKMPKVYKYISPLYILTYTLRLFMSNINYKFMLLH